MTVTRTTFATLTNSVFARGVVLSPYDGYFYACNSDSTISKISSDGATVTTFATLTDAAYWLCVDSSGNLYALSGASETIYKVDTAGSVTTYVDLTGYTSTGGICVDSSGNVYYGGVSSGNTVVWKVDTSLSISFFSGTNNILSMFRILSLCLDGSGNMYAGLESGNVAKIDSAGNATSFAPSVGGSLNIQGITYRSNTVYVNCYSSLSDEFLSINTSGTPTALYTDSSNHGYGLCTDYTGHVYLAGYASGAGIIWKFTFTTTTNNHAKKSSLAMSGH